MITLLQIYEQVSSTNNFNNIELFKKNWNLIKDMLYIYYFQTANEKDKDTTELKNLEGFQGPDASVLSPLCKQLIHTGWLSNEQLEIIPKRMLKYAKQVKKINDQRLIENDHEFLAIVDDVIEKWKKNVRHNLNKWFGVCHKDRWVADFNDIDKENIKRAARENNLYIFKLTKFFVIFLTESIPNLKKFMEDEYIKKSFRMSVHPSSDYPEIIAVKGKKELIKNFGVPYGKNLQIKQIRKPTNLIERRKLTEGYLSNIATDKQLRYLSALTHQSYVGREIGFDLIQKLIKMAKDGIDNNEIWNTYLNDPSTKRRAEINKWQEEGKKSNQEKRKKEIEFENILLLSKRHLMTQDSKVVNFITNILKKSMASHIQPYGITTEITSKIIMPTINYDFGKHFDIDKYSDYILNKYFNNNRLRKYFDAIGWPLDLMITHNLKVYTFILKIMEDFIKQKTGDNDFKFIIDSK